VVVMFVQVLGGPVAIIVALGVAIMGLAMSSSKGKGIMEAFGKVLKMFGTFAEQLAAEILPIVDEIIPPIMEALGAVMAAVGAVTSVIASAIAVVIKTVLVPVLKFLAEVITEIAAAIVKAVGWLRRNVGLQLSDAAANYDPNKKTATAARQAQMGDIRGLANRAYTSAYNTASRSTAEDQLSEAQQANRLLGQIAANTASGDTASGAVGAAAAAAPARPTAGSSAPAPAAPPARDEHRWRALR